MAMTRIHVSGFTAQVMSRQDLVAGTVGLPVEFTFGEDWQALKKTAVFRCDGVTYTVLEIEDTAIIPWELLRKPGCTLKAGVYGVSEDGSVQTPTLWAELGKIQEGADPSGGESADPTLPVWQQISEKKLDKPENAPAVGKTLKVAAVNIDGTFTCEWADDSSPDSGKWELIEEIQIDEEAVVERRYNDRYKKIAVIIEDRENKVPKVRLLGGSFYWEFYGFNAYTYNRLSVFGEIVIPNVLSNAYTMYGGDGGNAYQAWAIAGRLYNPASNFDGFKTESVCHVGTKIKVYGVKTA